MAVIVSHVDDSEVRKGLQTLESRFSKESLSTRVSVPLAQQLLEFAIESPIPRDKGTLAGSDSVQLNSANGEVTFGFNSVYAAFMDQPGKTGYVTIKPRRKKALYIPLSRKGEKHRFCHNPKDEGLEWGKDYVLKKSVRVPIRTYGSSKGPNHYFSETLKRREKWFFEAFARRATRVLEGEK